VLTEIATIPLIFKRPILGKIFAMIAALLNIFQVIADQSQLMHQEVASLGYSLLFFT